MKNVACLRDSFEAAARAISEFGAVALVSRWSITLRKPTGEAPGSKTRRGVGPVSLSRCEKTVVGARFSPALAKVEVAKLAHREVSMYARGTDGSNSCIPFELEARRYGAHAPATHFDGSYELPGRLDRIRERMDF